MPDGTDPPAPRTLEERKADALAILSQHHADVWVSSASTEGRAHLVPLSFAWCEGQVLLAVQAASATGTNIVASRRARLGFGHTRDVVMVDARLIEAVPVHEAPDDLAEAYAAQSDWDPRPGAAADYVYLRLAPQRIQVWRESNEIAGRTVMRRGEWLV